MRKNLGFLTPILFRNDNIHLLLNKKLQKQICEKIYSACTKHEEEIISIHDKNSSYYNPIESLGSRHADNDRVIVITGNTWDDLSNYAYSEINPNNIEFLKSCVKIAQYDITRLKQKIKEYEDKSKKN